MKSPKLIAGFAIAHLAALSAQSQVAFTNLNFEQANPVPIVGSPYYPYAVTAASALPYWTVTIGGVQATQVFYNDESLGSPSVSLIGPGHNPNVVPPPIDGNYSVLLQGSFPGSAAISQTGLIPAGTQSLLFEAEQDSPGPAGTLEVLVGNQVVPFAAVGTGPNYTLYGANISAWDGDNEQLTFSALQDNSDLNNWEIDDISFSTTVVSPEPNIVALTAIGGLLFGARKWFARRC